MTSDPNVEATSPTVETTPERVVDVTQPEQPAPYHRPSPYQTFAKPEEIKRESENRSALGLPNASIPEVCAEWGVEVPLEFDSLAHGTLS